MDSTQDDLFGYGWFRAASQISTLNCISSASNRLHHSDRCMTAVGPTTGRQRAYPSGRFARTLNDVVRAPCIGANGLRDWRSVAPLSISRSVPCKKTALGIAQAQVPPSQAAGYPTLWALLTPRLVADSSLPVRPHSANGRGLVTIPPAEAPMPLRRQANPLGVGIFWAASRSRLRGLVLLGNMMLRGSSQALSFRHLDIDNPRNSRPANAAAVRWQSHFVHPKAAGR